MLLAFINRNFPLILFKAGSYKYETVRENMVCIRCKMIVKQQLKRLSVRYICVELGEVEIVGNLSEVQLQDFKVALSKFGLELLNDKKSILIEKIKKVIVELVHYAEEPAKVNFNSLGHYPLNE
ncbi:hypothetical protein [Mucilaginibacter psychrotolerans]|uniref:hypothetical protein n=1 Tax=Mucilaginibacter psychrotolerans TaxID=1524096 RepID=UPI001F02CEAD|nr:hypothetical protein [Mucilaginibacter psychrotolerans]